MIGELTGGVFGPPIAGRLADSLGLEVTMYIQGGMALCGGLIALFIVETKPAHPRAPRRSSCVSLERRQVVIVGAGPVRLADRARPRADRVSR
jgi:predicted MFS family arabinose efflux permease